MDMEQHLPETILVDWSNRTISCQGPEARVVQVCFNRQKRKGVDLFLFCCCVAIAQELNLSGVRRTSWRGACSPFLDEVVSHFGWQMRERTRANYWSRLARGLRGTTQAARVFVIDGENRKLVDKCEGVFCSVDGLVLGPPEKLPDGTHRLCLIEFQNTDKHFTGLYDAVKALVTQAECSRHLPRQHRCSSASLTLSDQAMLRFRRRLQREALQGLRRQLRSRSTKDYVPLRLQVRRQLYPAKEHWAAGAQGQQLVDKGAVWDPLPAQEFWRRGRAFFLSSVSGAGKTTFLRHLQNTILRSGREIALYYQARDLVDVAKTGWPGLLREASTRLAAASSDDGLEGRLNQAYENGECVFLLDGMDNLGITGENCAHLAQQLLSSACGNRVIMAGRPSAARWVENTCPVTFLRLEPFDEGACRALFGITYEAAKECCNRDWDLVRNPMLAYALKQVLIGNPSRHIESRWQLFTLFLNHILHKHGPNLRARWHDSWARRILRTLGHVAYRAIDQEEALWIAIPVDLVEGPARSEGIHIEDLSAFGLADLVAVETDAPDPALVFTHQSFQEYLAASWAAKSPDCCAHVLTEYWKVKWKEVLVFLAGAVGPQRLISRLGLGLDGDDMFGSKTLVAAECAREGHLPRALRGELTSRLRRLVKAGVMREDYDQAIAAHRAMARMGSEEASKIAWSDYVFDRLHAEDPICFPVSSVSELFSSDRLDEIISRVLRGQKPGLFEILGAWEDHLSGGQVDEIYRWSLLDHKKCSWAGWVLGSIRNRLTREQVDAALDLHLRRPRADLLHGLSCCASRLDDKQVRSLVQSIPRAGMRCPDSVLRQVQTRVDAETVAPLFSWVWGRTVLLSDEFLRLCSVLGELIGDRDICLCVEQLRKPRSSASFVAGLLLEGAGQRLESEQAEALIQHALSRGGGGAGYLRAVIESPVMDAGKARVMLDVLRDGIRPGLYAVVDVCYLLEMYCEDEDFDALVRLACGGGSGVCDDSLYACSLVFRSLSVQQRRAVVREIVRRGRTDTVHCGSVPSIVSGDLTVEEWSMVKEAMDQGANPFQGYLRAMLAPVAMALDEKIEILCSLFRRDSGWLWSRESEGIPRMAFHDLRRLHRAGVFSGDLGGRGAAFAMSTRWL